MIIKPVQTKTPAGQKTIRELLNRCQEVDTGCSKVVTEILAAVRENGDDALLGYIRLFDAPDFQLAQLKVSG